MSDLRPYSGAPGHLPSTALQSIDDAIDRAARTDAMVLITGEPGVGKGVAAAQIHRRSHRASRSMLTMNCAGLPDVLIESDLFGHVRGSFEGAFRDKPGLLEVAPDGTLLLNDVDCLSQRLQASLQRFLESGTFSRIGAADVRLSARVRLVATTAESFPSSFDDSRFCLDVPGRPDVIRLAIPPLRERPEDVPALVEAFLTTFGQRRASEPCRMSPEAMAVLVAHRWPGNVRELERLIERVSRDETGAVILPADLASRGFVARLFDGSSARRTDLSTVL